MFAAICAGCGSSSSSSGTTPEGGGVAGAPGAGGSSGSAGAAGAAGAATGCAAATPACKSCFEQVTCKAQYDAYQADATCKTAEKPLGSCVCGAKGAAAVTACLTTLSTAGGTKASDLTTCANTNCKAACGL